MVQDIKLPDTITSGILRPRASRASLTTPAGLQANGTLTLRRAAFLALNMLTIAGLLVWAGSILGTGGWTTLDIALFIGVVFGTPWSVLGFWHAAIGLWVLHGRRNGLSDIAPYLDAGKSPEPLFEKTALVMTLRNEDPVRAIRRLRAMKASLDASGQGDAFGYFILSDTDRPEIAAAEEAAFAEWRALEASQARIAYRRRPKNTAFKAGNLREFCATRGRDYDLMLPLDADSVMTGEGIVKLARIMQTYPKLGILQTLVVGTPSSSAFARFFQFGMRAGMRTYTAAQAWWTGDCGPYWGHNAILRIKPYVDLCALPLLSGPPPLGGHILSHDQVEATLMRRGGYEVRVMPVESGSYEDNPPDALEFIQRDVRWCQGNMQYVKLMGLRGLQSVSRFQLIWAVLMFAGIPAWTLMIGALPFAVVEAQHVADFPIASAQTFYVTILLMYLSPKIAGWIDAVLTPGEVQRFGGALRFSVGALVEVVFSFLQGAISTVRTSIFLLGLLFGKSITWSGQERDGRGVSWRAAATALWPQLLFGSVVCSALTVLSPTTLLWTLPLTAGYLLAIPFAVMTGDPRFGAWLRRNGFAAVPEDFAPPSEIAAIQATRST